MAFICRPILLYSEFIPTITGTRTWEYQAFGHYDGIDVKERVVLQDGSSYEKLFQIYREYEEELNSYFTQMLVGFYEDEKAECAFWNEEAPILYLTLLQIKGMDKTSVAECAKYLMSENYIKETICDCGLKEGQDAIKVQAYFSLDNSELLLAIKCYYPSTGAAMINNLHQKSLVHNKLCIRNSYSILGIKRTVIEAEKMPDGFSEEIDMVELRLIQRKSNAIDELHDVITEKIKKDNLHTQVTARMLFGTEDGTIFIEKIPWNRLLPFYRMGTGELCNSNKISKRYAYAISTKIMFPFSDNTKERGKSDINVSLKRKDSDAQPMNDEENTDQSFCSFLSKKVEAIYQKATVVKNFGEQKNLMMFIEALQRFEITDDEKNPFTDYNIYTIYLPFYMFLRLRKEACNGNTECYYEFMKSMNLRTQNFVKPDRVFSQITDFNMRYFDIPLKLITIYSAYVYYMKKALNTEKKKEYEFLICPGEDDRMEVKELFCHELDEGRLFLIKMPENQTYAVKHMLIMLGHETAHFVGTELRQREERKKHIIKMCARIVVLAMHNYISYYNGCDMRENLESEWGALEENMCKWLPVYLNRNEDDEYLKKYQYQSYLQGVTQKNVEYNKKNGAHAEVLQMNLVQAVWEMLSERGEQLFGFVFAEEYRRKEKENVDYDSFFSERKKELWWCIDMFLASAKMRKRAMTIEEALNNAVYLVKECYADMLCILTLHITPKDYFRSFVEEFKAAQKSVKDMEATVLIARVAVVCVVMSTQNRKNSAVGWSYYWKDEDLKIIENETDELYVFEQTVLCFMEDYIKESKAIKTAEEVADAVDIVFDQKILLEVIKYLLKCREKYENLMENRRKQEYVEQVQKFLIMAQEQNAIGFFGRMAKLLTDYKSAVWEEIEAVKKTEE